MTKVIPITKDIVEAFQEATAKMEALSNILCEKDNSLSVTVELSSRPSSIRVALFKWEDGEVVFSDHYEWYYDNDSAGDKKGKLFAKIDEWEATYGME